MPGAFDWSPVVKYMCELEGNRDTWAEKAERAGSAITRGLKRDALQERPLEPAALPPAAGVISSLCPEAACPRPAPPGDPAPARGPSGPQRELPDHLLHGGGQEVPGPAPEREIPAGGPAGGRLHHGAAGEGRSGR